MFVAIRNILRADAWLAISPVFGAQAWAQKDDGKLKPFLVAYRGSNAVATGGLALTLVALQAALHMKEQSSGPIELQYSEIPILVQILRRFCTVQLIRICNVDLSTLA